MRNAILITLCCFATAFSTLQAQSFGYVNSQELLQGMEEVKAAESNLVGFRDQKQKMLQMEIEKFQQQLATLEKRNAEGDLTPKQIEEEQARMQTEQQRIGKMESEMGQEIAARREKEFQPIFDKVNAAIEKIAKEKSYQYVFDAAAGGVILYADESMNLTAEVKAAIAAM